MRKNCACDREKLLKFEAEGREFAKNFEITKTIYSNSERSEQFLVTECFFNLFLEVSHTQQKNSNWKKLLGLRNIQEKLEKVNP